MNNDTLALLRELEAAAVRAKLPLPTVLTAGARLARATFCAGWFFNRAYTKPRGYPGDYLILQRIYDRELTANPLGALLDRSFLAAPSAKAVRNRREILRELLRDRWLEHQEAKPGALLSLGSGPGQEIVDLAVYQQERPAPTGRCHSRPLVVAVDFDPGALRHLQRGLGINAPFELRAIRGDVRALDVSTVPPVAFAYSAGLFDYLSDAEAIALVDRVWHALRPGGTFVLANFADRRPVEDRFSMDYVMEWKLIFRDEAALRDLVGRTRFKDPVAILAESHHINLFAILEKE